MIPVIKNLQFAESDNFFLIAGPCVVESEKNCLTIAAEISRISERLKIPFIFKASYRKANRSRIDSFTGIGDTEALQIVQHTGKIYNIPTVTDIHESHEAAIAAGFVDVLQIPAFLCRQTDLLVAAAQTGKFVNVKKGQFLSPGAMIHVVSKIKEAGNDNIMLTERGTTFGYSDLVVDYRAIPHMQEFAVPVIMDCTHALQQPNQSSGVTGGQPQLIATIARAAIAVGTDGIFIETHPDPANALSDGANMLPLHKLEELLEELVAIRQVIRKNKK